MALLDLSGAIERVTVETTITPPITIDRPLQGGGKGGIAPGFLVAGLRPRITVRSFGQDYQVAPFGAPPKLWPLALALVVAGVAAVSYYVVKGVRA